MWTKFRGWVDRVWNANKYKLIDAICFQLTLIEKLVAGKIYEGGKGHITTVQSEKTAKDIIDYLKDYIKKQL